MADGYEAIQKLALARSDWLPIAPAALREADGTGDNGFAGRWVLNDLRRHNWPGLQSQADRVQSFPRLRVLQRYGVLARRDSTRRGHRAYYTMPDKQGVRRPLAHVGALDHG